MIEGVFPIVRDVQIRIPIIVVIAYGYAHSVVSISGIRQPRCLCDISETAVGILPVKTIPILRFVTVEQFRSPHGIRKATAVHEKNIEQAVVVVVEKGDAASHGFDQILLARG